MSTAQNNVLVERADRILAPIGTTVAIKQGDLVKVTSNLAVVINGAQDAVIGMADDSNPIASLGGDCNPNIGGAAGAIMVLLNSPYKGCAIINMILTSGQTLAFWTAVYQTADPQTVTASSSSATQIGRMMGLVSVTGDGVVKVPVLMCGAN